MVATLAKEIQHHLMFINKATIDESEKTQNLIYEKLTSSLKKGSREDKAIEEAIELILENYLQTQSERVFKILIETPSRLHDALITIINNRLSSGNELKRQTILLFYLKVVHAQPCWLARLVTQQTAELIIGIISSSGEVVLMARAALVMLELISALPSVILECLDHLFETFSHLCTFLYLRVFSDDCLVDKNALHLNSIVYRLFVRLYGMFPSTFTAYLKQIYGPSGRSIEDRCFSTENVFQRVIKPMLSLVKFHPQLIVSNSDIECAHFRGAAFESHHILDVVGQLSLDCDEFMPDITAQHISTGDLYHNFCSPCEEELEEDDSLEESDYRLVSERRDSQDPPPALSVKAATGSHIVRPRAISSRDSLEQEDSPNDAQEVLATTGSSPFKPIKSDEHEHDEEVETIYNDNLTRKTELERTKRELRESKAKMTQFSPEFIGKVKKSLREANKRIRYKSTCLPETEKLDEFLGQTPPSMSSLDRSVEAEEQHNLIRLRVASKSCPILFFEWKEEALWGDYRPMRQRHVSNLSQGKTTSSKPTIHGKETKPVVMLRNPNVEASHTRQARFKACKSVDYSREAHFTQARHRRPSNWESRHKSQQQQLAHLNQSQSLSEIVSGNMRKTPHELLTNMLELNTEVYFKAGADTRQLAKQGNLVAFSEKDKKMVIEGEANLRRQLALLYSQLMYERYQRDLHVLYNRRLFKQIKEAEKMKEMYRAAQEQLRLQEVEIEKIHKQLETKLLDFEENSLGMRAQVSELMQQLHQTKHTLNRVQCEKDACLIKFTNEIESLNVASHLMHTEVAATLKALDREGQIDKLKTENAELKEKLLLFASAHDKLKEAFDKTKMFASAEAGNVFEFEALKQDNQDLQDKLNQALARNQALVLQLAKKNEDLAHKEDNGDHVLELKILEAKLNMKDQQVEEYKTVIQVLERHIQNTYATIESDSARNKTGQTVSKLVEYKLTTQ